MFRKVDGEIFAPAFQHIEEFLIRRNSRFTFSHPPDEALDASVENGLAPACVTACATGALFFGKRDEVLAEATRRMKGRPDVKMYGENELGGLGWITLIDRKATEVGLIEDPKAATKGILAKWFAGIIPGVAMLAGIGWLFKRRTELAEKSSAEPKA